MTPPRDGAPVSTGAHDLQGTPPRSPGGRSSLLLLPQREQSPENGISKLGLSTVLFNSEQFHNAKAGLTAHQVEAFRIATSTKKHHAEADKALGHLSRRRKSSFQSGHRLLPERTNEGDPSGGSSDSP